MRRRTFCLAALALAGMIAAAALPGPERPRLLLLEWASRAAPEKPDAAVLVEMGLKDTQPEAWSGRLVSATNCRVQAREGYRFRDGDRFESTDSWRASTHRATKLPPRRPDLQKAEPIATVGVVFTLTGVLPGAKLVLDMKRPDLEKVTVSVDDVLGGDAQTIWGGAAVVRRVSVPVGLSTGVTEDDFPAAAYGPDGTIWVAYIAYTIRDPSRRIGQFPLAAQPADFKGLYTPGFADQLFVHYCRDRRWSPPIPVGAPSQDLVRCAMAVDGDGTPWVIYSAQRDGAHTLYARPLATTRPGAFPQVGPEQKLGTGGDRDLNPATCTAQDGTIHLAWQSGAAGKFVVRHDRLRKGALAGGGDTWGDKAQGNAWTPALAAGPDAVSVAYDCYRDGDYDVVLGKDTLAGSSRFEARPSACWDDQGRLWVAYEEGPDKWGKDYGAMDPGDGNPLYNERAIRVVCLKDGKLLRPAAELPAAKNPPQRLARQESKDGEVESRAWIHYEAARRQSNPRLGLDGRGRLWLTYREKFGSRYTTTPGSYWLSYARRLDGDHWTEPIEVLHSDGALDGRAVLLPHMAGGLVIVHNGDGRYSSPEDLGNRVYAGYLDLPGDPVEPKLVPASIPAKDAAAAARHREAVRRMREYHVRAGGKDYRLLRGEFHRHTDISWDGGSDGSLEDMFRYALDAAALDWVANADHDNGDGREYPWWLTQKLTDALHLAGAFTPVFGYERSVDYPHGHRNCLFTRRGVRTLPRLAQPDKDKQVGGIHADDTKMLYRYLRELGGLCSSHTSATNMGTDWRDNDAELEPVVEIYQGDRMSYEKEGAPRTGNDPKSGKPPANLGGWYPLGYVDHALQKGYRLGFQASSDHWSTHISYAVVLAERNDRDSILDAIKRRHCYASTDDIVLDVHSGEHVMGDEFKAAAAPAFDVHVVGTGPLDAVEVLRDSEVVATLPANGPECKATWTDPKPQAGRHYYYIRVRQKDGQLAWGSPLWVEQGR
jgi:hypothetical protein